MDITDKCLLESDGWEVVCESPLEIYHKDSNSSATGIAVQYVIDGRKLEAEIED